MWNWTKVVVLLIWCGQMQGLPRGALTGHKRQLGHQGTRLNVAEVRGFLPAGEFISKHVVKNQPLIMRNGAQISRGYHFWTDEYMSGMAPLPPNGNITFESGRVETRKGGFGRMHFKDFIRTYKNEDIYMVDDVPTWLTSDVVVPPSLQCPQFAHGAFDKLMIWMSGGGTSSVLHTDSRTETLDCMFRGSKTYILINSTKFQHLLPDVINEEGYNGRVDINSVDVNKFPVFNKLDYHIAHLNRGDCLYLPANWPHQVRASNESNLSVTLWWDESVTPKIDLSKCNQDFDTGFTFDKVVLVDWQTIQRHIGDYRRFRKRLVTQLELTTLNKQQLVEWMTADCPPMREDESAKKTFQQLFELLDVKKNLVLDKKDFTQQHEHPIPLDRKLAAIIKLNEIMKNLIAAHPRECTSKVFLTTEESPKNDADADDDEKMNVDTPVDRLQPLIHVEL